MFIWKASYSRDGSTEAWDEKYFMTELAADRWVREQNVDSSKGWVDVEQIEVK